MRHHRFFPHCAPVATVIASALFLAAVGCRDEAAVARRDSAELAALDSSTSLAAANAARRERDKKTNIYAATDTDGLSAAVRAALPRAYVPNSLSASVTVIDQSTHRVLRTFATGKVPQHVVPAYDLKTLWVLNNSDNSLTPIDPTTGLEGARVKVDDPYNLYFTPDGQTAIVIAEKRQRLDFRNPHTMELVKSLHVPCRGLDHVDFTVDNRYMIATCEFSAHLVKVDLMTQTVVGSLMLAAKMKESMPQDIRSSPDGTVFYVADMKQNGLHVIDPSTMKYLSFIPTGKGAHGITVGRGGRVLYISNRGWNNIYGGRRGPGSISVLDPKTEKIIDTWPIPGGGSPDMGNVSADGKELWVSGRYDDEVYVLDTTTGKLIDRVPVGREPHGVCVWPQPGRYSLGHTGNMR
jgi:YVTN family beta-propeller protein